MTVAGERSATEQLPPKQIAPVSTTLVNLDTFVHQKWSQDFCLRGKFEDQQASDAFPGCERCWTGIRMGARQDLSGQGVPRNALPTTKGFYGGSA